MSQEQIERSGDFLAKHPDLIKQYNKTLNNDKVTIESAVTPLSAAAPLTDYYMYFVASYYDSSTTNISNYEIVTNESTTQKDFNGTVYVGTMEIGYGNEYATKFNQTVLGSKYDVVYLDFNGDKVVDGMIDVWKIDNVTSGKFTSSSTSMNGTGDFTTGINIL